MWLIIALLFPMFGYAGLGGLVVTWSLVVNLSSLSYIWIMDYGAGSLSRIKDSVLRQCVVLSIFETGFREGEVDRTGRAAVVRLDALLCALLDERKLASLLISISDYDSRNRVILHHLQFQCVLPSSVIPLARLRGLSVI
jgi:hypothetical protein